MSEVTRIINVSNKVMENYDGSEQKYIENWKRDGHQVDLPTHIN